MHQPVAAACLVYNTLIEQPPLGYLTLSLEFKIPHSEKCWRGKTLVQCIVGASLSNTKHIAFVTTLTFSKCMTLMFYMIVLISVCFVVNSYSHEIKRSLSVSFFNMALAIDLVDRCLHVTLPCTKTRCVFSFLNMLLFSIECTSNN